jgi:hypothetical protein
MIRHRMIRYFVELLPQPGGKKSDSIVGLRAEIKNDSYTPKRIGLEDPSLRVRMRPSCQILDPESVTHICVLVDSIRSKQLREVPSRGIKEARYGPGILSTILQ